MTSLEKKILLWTIIIVTGHLIGSLWLYDATNWFDKVVHFSGGVWLAFIIILFQKKFSFLKPTIFVFFVIAVLWENFEGLINWYALAKYGIATSVGGSAIDTILDVVSGTLGATVAVLFSKRRD